MGLLSGWDQRAEIKLISGQLHKTDGNTITIRSFPSFYLNRSLILATLFLTMLEFNGFFFQQRPINLIEIFQIPMRKNKNERKTKSIIDSLIKSKHWGKS